MVPLSFTGTKPINLIKAVPHRYNTIWGLHQRFFFLSNRKRFRQCYVTIAPHWKFSKRVHYHMYIVACDFEPRRIQQWPRLQKHTSNNKHIDLCAFNGLRWNVDLIIFRKKFEVVVRYVLRLVNRAEHSYMKCSMQYIQRRTFVNLL